MKNIIKIAVVSALVYGGYRFYKKMKSPKASGGKPVAKDQREANRMNVHNYIDELTGRELDPKDIEAAVLELVK